MQVDSIIKMSANVIKITSLRVGDVFKMVEASTYDSGVFYCLVLDLLNDGEKTFIHVLRYKNDYSEFLKGELKLYDGSKSMDIFPCTTGEVENYFEVALNGALGKIKEKENELAKLKIGYAKAVEFTSGEISKKLTEVSYKEMTQTEYETKKAAAKKELSYV